MQTSDKSILKRSVIVLLPQLFCCYAILATTAAFADCIPRPYREGRVWRDLNSSLTMNISLAIEDFAPTRLVCVVDELKRHYADRRSLTVYMFSSDDAARYYMGDIPIGDTVPAQGAEAVRLQKARWSGNLLHAVYSYDSHTHVDRVVLKPLGFADARAGDTTINLPSANIPRCRFEIARRCVLALDDLTYGREAYAEKVSGSVTLSGTLLQDGTVSDIHITDAKSNPVDRAEVFVGEARKHVESIRVEPATHDDPFRITYAYVISRSSIRQGQVKTEFRLPAQIRILANP